MVLKLTSKAVSKRGVTYQNNPNITDSLVHAFNSPHDTIRQLGLLSVFSEMQSDGHRVALVGEGADEFNLGYYRLYPGFQNGQGSAYSSEEFLKKWLEATKSAMSLFTDDFSKEVRPIDLAIETALRVPHKMNLAGSTEKLVLRKAFKEALPKGIINRDKMPLPENLYRRTQLLFYQDLEDRILTAHSVV